MKSSWSRRHAPPVTDSDAGSWSSSNVHAQCRRLRELPMSWHSLETQTKLATGMNALGEQTPCVCHNLQSDEDRQSFVENWILVCLVQFFRLWALESQKQNFLLRGKTFFWARRACKSNMFQISKHVDQLSLPSSRESMQQIKGKSRHLQNFDPKRVCSHFS